MNFEQLQQANASIKTVNVKGKEYAEVNQRIKAFRMCYPEGLIKTEIVSLQNGIVLMQAKIYTNEFDEHDNNKCLATGYAYEKENSSFINKTSYIENCETSAVGRALGMCGFGIDTSVASAEEVENAIANQGKRTKATKKQVEYIRENLNNEMALKSVLDIYGVKKIEDLTSEQASKIIGGK